jgi:hypothetical protein
MRNKFSNSIITLALRTWRGEFFDLDRELASQPMDMFREDA